MAINTKAPVRDDKFIHPGRSPIVTREKAQILPSEVSPRFYGDQNHPSLFSFYVDDVISMTTSGGSALMKWMPSQGVNWWMEPVAHLSWVAPEDFTGSDSYADFMASREAVEECDFGDGFVYQVCEYLNEMDRMSWSTRNQPIKQENMGMYLFKNQPRQVLRGNDQGLVIDNDRDWSLSLLGMGSEEEVNWNMIYGDPLAFPNTYEGINSLFTVGWVKNHARQRGSCDFTDPIVAQGTTLSTNEEILRKIRAVAHKIIRRMKQRNYVPSGDDMVILMNDVMWERLARTLAWGVLSTDNPPSGFNLQITSDRIVQELARITSGGLGEGFITVGNLQIPVITDVRIGASGVNGAGNPTVTGDIFILTKNFKGIRTLEHQYLDWSKLGDRPLPELSTWGATGTGFTPEFFQGNMLRVSVQTLNGNNLCWFYGADMYGRIVTKMQSLQGRINDVTVEMELDGDNENISFTSQDFFAFNGSKGGQGTDLLTPLT